MPPQISYPMRRSFGSVSGFLKEAEPPPPWSPADLGSALQLWLKADTGITLNGSDVSTWADQSGKGCDVSQGAGGFQPAYQAAGFNSLPTVFFTASNSDLLFSSASAATLGNATASCFIVGQMQSSTAAYGRAVGFCKSGGGGGDQNEAGSAAFILRNVSADQIGSYANNAFRGGAVAVTLSTNYRMGSIYDGANVTVYVNNVAGSTTAYSTVFGATGRINIGNETSNASGWHGPISEVVITNTALDSDTRLSLDNYFKSKWGLS